MRSLISAFYAQLLEPPPHTSIHYAAKWERDLGLQLDAKDWTDIWESTKSAFQIIVALEMNYKVLMHWSLVPVWIAKFLPTYSKAVQMQAHISTVGGPAHWPKHFGLKFSIFYLHCLLVLRILTRPWPYSKKNFRSDPPTI